MLCKILRFVYAILRLQFVHHSCTRMSSAGSETSSSVGQVKVWWGTFKSFLFPLPWILNALRSTAEPAGSLASLQTQLSTHGKFALVCGMSKRHLYRTCTWTHLVTTRLTHTTNTNTPTRNTTFALLTHLQDLFCT